MEGSPVDTHFACFSVESVGNHHPRQLLATVTPDEFETRIYVSPFVSPAKIGFSKVILLISLAWPSASLPSAAPAPAPRPSPWGRPCQSGESSRPGGTTRGS